MSRLRFGYAAALACAIAVTVAGSVSLPIDDHEAFVVQTAQEMRERGDWIVPHFNGKPRLNKPPLSYWAVAALADLSGTARVEPWQGRAPSIAGAVGLVALAMLLAAMLADHRTAVTTGFVAATSLGVFRYAHNARPDMLYAFWCTVVVTAFAWGARSPSPGRGAAAALWLAVALATLTKGPQLPVIMIGACVVFAVRSRWPARRILRTLRPASGLAGALALVLPWWWAVDRALPSGLRGTQLAGSLLTVSWSHVLDPYFFYRPLVLVAPSVAILVPALLRRRWPRWDDTTRFCAFLVLIPAAALSFGPQHRPHYMLPALAPLAILVASIVLAVVDGDRSRWAGRALAAIWVATIVGELSFASTDVLWSHDRFADASVARRAGTSFPTDVPLIALDLGAPAASYYAERAVREIRSPRRLLRLVDAAPGGTVGLLTSAEQLASIPDALAVAVLWRDSEGGAGQRILARVERPRHDEGTATEAPMSLFALSAETLDGTPQPLSAYAGKVLLVVNTASECGFTPQYAGLQALQEEYASRGFAVLGIPSNDFGGQEPGSPAQIAEFTRSKYHVTFPLLAKAATRGSAQSPIYAFLTRGRGEPQWNFHKYLVGRDGTVRGEFPSRVTPESDELRTAIEAALAE